ncbi:MAG: 50S ribosomal protein L5 [Archaeoglobaceae archaeon]
MQAVQQNPMEDVLLDKVVVNLCIGESGERHKKASNVLEELTGQTPTVTYAKKTVKNFGIRKGEAIGAKVTLRGDKAMDFLKRALTVIEHTLRNKQVGHGEFAFGIEEHIDLPGVSYDPDVGIYGMDVVVLLKKRGYRVERRRVERTKLGTKHKVTKEETMNYLKEFGVEVE